MAEIDCPGPTLAELDPDDDAADWVRRFGADLSWSGRRGC
jgi:hypothetical protein